MRDEELNARTEEAMARYLAIVQRLRRGKGGGPSLAQLSRVARPGDVHRM